MLVQKIKLNRNELAKYNKVSIVGKVSTTGFNDSIGKSICLEEADIYVLEYGKEKYIGTIDHIWLHGKKINRYYFNKQQEYKIVGYTGLYHKRSGLMQFGINPVEIYNA